MERTSIEVIEGDTWGATIICQTADGDPFDFSPGSLSLPIARAPGGDRLATLTDGSGLSVDYPDAGSVTIAVPTSVTTGVCRNRQPVRIYADLKYTQGAETITLAPLVFIVSPEVPDA